MSCAAESDYDREVVRRLEARHARNDEQGKVQALRELAAILQSHDNETVAAFVKRFKGQQTKRSSGNTEQMRRRRR